MKKLVFAFAVLVMLLPGVFASGQNTPQSTFDRYNFFPITLLVFIGIILSEIFIKDKLLQKYIWNVALLLAFVIAAITSLLYFLRLEGLHALIVTIHVEIGLIAVWIGLYHAFKHIAYYVKCRPRTRDCNKIE